MSGFSTLSTVVNIGAFCMAVSTFFILVFVYARSKQCRNVLKIVGVSALMATVLVECAVFAKLLIWEFSTISHEALLDFNFELNDYYKTVAAFVISLILLRGVPSCRPA